MKKGFGLSVFVGAVLILAAPVDRAHAQSSTKPKEVVRDVKSYRGIDQYALKAKGPDEESIASLAA